MYFSCQITTFIKVHVPLVFVLQTLQLKDFAKIFQLKVPKPQNKGHTNFYECCDLTKKVYLMYIHHSMHKERKKHLRFCICNSIFILPTAYKLVGLMMYSFNLCFFLHLFPSFYKCHTLYVHTYYNQF